MKRLTFILLTNITLNATTITELFDALSRQPLTQIDIINTQKAKVIKDKINSSYYPKVDLFGDYTHYNSVTNLKPIDPITTAKLTQNNSAIPFAQSIEKIGIKISIPIFIKELSTLNKKANILIQNAKLKKRLNLYQNEALIVGYNSSFEYLDNLLLALNQTKKSLETTRKNIKISVDLERTPAIALDKIDEKINNLNISINNIEIQKNKIISNIEQLTDIEIKNPIKMQLVSNINKSEIFALKPLKTALKASNLDVKATKEKREYPKVSLNMMWSQNYTNNTINNKSDSEGYGYYQIGLNMPIYNKSLDSDIEISKISVMKNRLQLEKTKQNLEVEAKQLEKELKLLKISKNLSLKNIKNRENLLKFAKVSFDTGRMTEEEYLRYEDELLQSKAKYYEIESKKWQNLAKLAVIYGNDLKGVIK